MTAAGLGLGGRKSYAVLSAQASYITQTVDVSGGQTLTVSFGGAANGGQTGFSVTIAADDDTLQAVVDKFNTASRGVTGEEYDIATIDYDEENGTYGIKLTAMWGDSDNDITVSGGEGDLSAWSVAAGTGQKLSIADPTEALGALNTLADAIETKDSYRAQMGYLMNRLESAVSVIDIQAENLLAAESRIADVDVAKEMAAMTRNQVLAQAGMSMLSQANSMPQMALSLLR
jgi:flagellin-like hook-associated protein FlgL